jgi:hypothetical protein
MHPFDASLAMQAVQGDSSAAHKAFSARTDGHYRNTIGPFGG